MTRYSVGLYSNQVGEIRKKKIECNEKEIPNTLVCIAMDYLKEGPYHDAVLAMVRAGRNTTTYIVDLRTDTVEVYCLVFQSNRAEIQEPSAEFAAPLDREESAR